MHDQMSLIDLGIHHHGPIHRNLTASRLVEKALANGEGQLTSSGALSVVTGKYTGRSPQDKFIVDTPAVHDQIAWGSVNRPINADRFERLWARMTAYLQQKELYIFDGYAGADHEHRLAIRVVNELAWQNLFVRQLFVRPTAEELAAHQPEFTVVCAPGFKAVPEVDGTNSEAFIIVHFERRMIIIGGTHYAGEMKKSIFSVMNYILPQKGILPMHCSANVGEAGDVALFFGLSGTGKTTLSADPERRLIGDDEHGWTDEGVFNFEGGCYAKCINLSHEHEPQIWDAIRFGSVLENVKVDPQTGEIDFASEELTENTRAAYPVDYIPGAVLPSVGGQPKTIFFLTADAFGVLPPIARLTKEQAMYYFLSGYTSKLAGTERGIVSPQATFSTCFGEPFLPLDPVVYAELLGQKTEENGVRVFLLNTGWTGGGYGVGKRMSIKHTRAMVSAALKGDLDKVEYVTDPIFGLPIPTSCPNVPAEVLNPRNTWSDKEAYDRQAKDLAARFKQNYTKFNARLENVKVVTAAGR
ncbi:MAG: phosphoenolpyruvate carboxykinase (ATP) [Bacillota bacterium]